MKKFFQFYYISVHIYFRIAILDATVAPADISYPNDLGLLNKAREQTETIIDSLYKPLKEELKKKPRTYRKIARKDYLKVAKKKRVTQKERRKAIKKQLQYLGRNRYYIEEMITRKGSVLSKKHEKMLLVIDEIDRQQRWMYENKKNSIEKRIVSLTQPHVRPIVRGKAGKPVEFGAKLGVSYIEGYVFVDKISWDNFNESGELKAQIEYYKILTGY